MLPYAAGPILYAALGLMLAQTPVAPRDTPSQPAPAVQAPGLFAKHATKPYEGVFIVPAQRPAGRGNFASATAREGKTRIRCGMMVVEADPSIDPKILLRVTVDPDPKMVVPIPPCPEDKR